MKPLRWVWTSFLGFEVYGEGQQNTTVLNPRLYYFESGKDIQLVTQQEYYWNGQNYQSPQNICNIYQSTDICYNFQDQDGVKSPCTQENNYQLTYRYGAPLRPAIVGCRDPDTVGLIPDEWDATLRRSGYQSISKGRDDHCHHSLFPPGMQAFAKCDDESYTLPANGDVPEITLTGFYVAPYLPYFNPNKNYIGAVILAVHDGNRWYHDGRSEAWHREARNHWDGRSIVTASIKPGYIIMREADELQNDFYYANYNVPGDITFHNALLADFFAFWNPKLNNPRWDEPPSDFDREQITLIGWGFSYQAVDTRTNDYFCDFKFNSFTFNAGQTVNMDSNIKITNHGDGNGKKNLVHAQLQNFIRLSVNYWRENVKNPRYDQYDYRERLLRVTKINEWGKEHKWDNLMQCDYNNKPKPTPEPTTTVKSTSTTKQSSPTPVDSSTPSARAETKTTTPPVTTTTASVTTQASKSCEVTMVAKDRLKCHRGKMGRKASERFGRYATIHEVKSSNFATDNVRMGRMADPRGAAFEIGHWKNGNWELNAAIPGKTNEYERNLEPCHPDNKFFQFFLCRNDSKKLGLRAQDDN